MTTLPAPPIPAPPITQAPGRAVGIAAIVSGIVGFLILPIVFGPIALILGVVAVAQKYDLGWIAIGLGGLELILVAKAFYEISQALEAL